FPDGKIHAAAQDGAQTVAGVDQRHSQPVVSQQGVSEEHHALTTPGETRSDENSIFRPVLVGVAAVVRFQGPVRIEVVGSAGARALRNVAHLLGYGSAWRLKWGRDGGAWVHALIANEDIYFRRGLVLRHCGN